MICPFFVAAFVAVDCPLSLQECRTIEVEVSQISTILVNLDE